MKQYKFFDVHYMAGEVRLWCSDPVVLMGIVEDLRKVTPFSISHEVNDLETDLYPEQRTHCILHRFKDNHDAAYMWIVRQLCQAGWEPFSTAIGTIEASRVISFRISI